MADNDADPEAPRPLSDAEVKARNRRNLWLAFALVGFVVLVAAVTMARLGAGIPERL